MMKFNTVIVILSIAAFVSISCSRPASVESRIDSVSTVEGASDTTKKVSIDYDSYLKLESYLSSAQADTSLSQVIDFNCAIIVNPTDKQIEEMIKENGEEDFATLADDMSFYQSEASQKIDSVGIKSTSASKQFITLKGDQKTWTLDIRKANMPEWNIIFFNRNKDPEIISAIDLSTQHVRDYFDVKQ